MQIKVCGMKDAQNIKDLVQLPIDWMGLIFYEKSPRYAGDLDANVLDIVPPSIQKVGVFVNASIENILDRIRQYDLQAVQLHGDESPAFCRELKKHNIQVIKTFSIEEADDLAQCIFYENTCDYFLFDTKTPQYGGSGKKFDWQFLFFHKGEIPFFLSGGIGLEDAKTIQQLNFPQLHAVDLNSRFEIMPGLKDIDKIKKFLSYEQNNPIIQ
jgi:phosphoribosylanthranilate isomerase